MDWLKPTHAPVLLATVVCSVQEWGSDLSILTRVNLMTLAENLGVTDSSPLVMSGSLSPDVLSKWPGVSREGNT